MKKRVAVLFFMGSLTIGLLGQSLIPSEMGIGIGLYNSNIFYEHNYGGGLNDYLPTFGYSIGIKTAWAFDKKTSFHLGLNYNQQGQRHEDWKIENDPEYYFQRRIDISYFKMPIYVQRIYKNQKPLQWLWQAGIYTGILNQAKLTYIRRGESLSFYDAVTEKNNFANEITEPDSHNDLFQNVDIGFILGWGIQYSINERVRLMTTLRSELGVIDINDKDWRYPHPEFGYRSSRHSLVGLSISIQNQIQ